MPRPSQTGGTKPGIQPGSSLSPQTGHGELTITPGPISRINEPSPGSNTGR